MANLDIFEKLKKASDGLLFMNEADYPFELLVWGGQKDW
ncbi:hypothetical protein H6F97_00385 [Microcoleus sp. FACHB-1]|nr:hypothetical protein [Microcoleus sp. FACHB-1]